MPNLYYPYYRFFKDPLLIKAEVFYALEESTERCLHHNSKFLSELMVTLKDIPPFFEFENESNAFIHFDLKPAFTNLEDFLVFCKARAYFDLEDFPSCAHIARYTNNSKSMFLHYMARYLSMHYEFMYGRTNIFDSFEPINKREYMELLNELLILNGIEDDFVNKSEDEPQPQKSSDLDSINPKPSEQQQEDDSIPEQGQCSRNSLRIEKIRSTTTRKNNQTTKHNNTAKKVKVTASAAQSETNMSADDLKDTQIKEQDPYLLWLTAVMLKRIDRCDEAIDILVRAIQMQPCYWGAWIELSTLVKDRKMLDTLNIQLNKSKECHWMHLLFIAQMNVNLQLTKEAVTIYEHIFKCTHSVFKNWPYLNAQLAIAQHEDNISNALVSFRTVMKLDPFRIDNFDLLSSLFYTSDRGDKLADLSKYVASVDCFRQESLCVQGNMYSLKRDHDKSVLYFKKALSINPFNATAWILLGHEYTESNNTQAGIISYRQALKMNIIDYRAWYGLSKIYEVMKLPNYALLYFAKACDSRPKDFQMLISLGEMFERNDRIFESMVCLYNALIYDTYGSVILKLGEFYDKYGDDSNEVASENFNTMNKRALKIGIKNRTTIELNLILSKIYLFLGHNYMDLHLYGRAISMAGKCRGLWTEADTIVGQSLGVTEHVNALLAEIEARAGPQSSLTSTPGAINARKALFALE